MLSFINAWLFKWEKCVPPPTTGDIMVAWRGTEILGTVALDFGDALNPFPIEKVHDFEGIWKFFPGTQRAFDRSLFVQTGRWSATERGVSEGIIHAIAEDLYPKGVRYLIFEGKDHAFQALERYGLRFLVLYGLTMRMDGIPEEGMKYYTTPPRPKIVMVDVKNILEVLGR